MTVSTINLIQLHFKVTKHLVLPSEKKEPLSILDICVFFASKAIIVESCVHLPTL